MQIVSMGDNLHEMSNPVFWEKYFKMMSDDFAKRVLTVKVSRYLWQIQYSTKIMYVNSDDPH